MHAGDYDISTLKRDYDFTFNNVFDTMLAASALGESSLGLSTLLEKYFGIELAKKNTSVPTGGERPVKDDMLRYAQADSHFLIPLRDYLLPRLEAIGWLELVQEDTNAMAKNTLAMRPHCEDVWRIKGTRDLSPAEMSLLAELNHQRELQAQNATARRLKSLATHRWWLSPRLCPPKRSKSFPRSRSFRNTK